MGYDAFVPCNCFWEGRASPPPFPLVWLHEEGVFDAASGPPEPDMESWGQLSLWQRSACAHPRMHLIQLRLGNIAAVAELRGAIATIGAAQLPTLAAVLPVANGGLVEPERAPAVLRDLERFEQLAQRLPCTGLVAVATGIPAFTVVAGGATPFMWTPDGTMGFDADGLFVERDGAEVFRARHVRMHPGTEQRCAVEDVESGTVLHNAPCPDLGATEWRVQPAYLGIERFEGMVADLRTLFETSLKIGRPVYWF